jgi:hypothetical protein
MYALEAPAQVTQDVVTGVATVKSGTKAETHKKGGFFKQWRALKKGMKLAKAWVQDQVGNMDSLALILFIIGVILICLGAFISVALLYVGLAAMLTSDVLSFVILATSEDPKARKKAKTILWASLALVLLAAIIALLAYVLLIAALAAIF